MQLLASKPSPYARKCRAAVIELGLADRVAVELVPPRLPLDPKPDVEAVNPLSKVPILVTPGGPIVDSRVICAFLNELAGGTLVAAGENGWRERTLEALADGMIDAGVVVRLEMVRPEAERRPADIAAYRGKIERTLDLLERDPPARDRFHVGHLALVCAIDWMRFRSITRRDPLEARPGLAALHAHWTERDCLRATRPEG